MVDRAFPMGFVVVAAFASGLIWLYAVMSTVPLR
jgi:hypothetical protein